MNLKHRFAVFRGRGVFCALRQVSIALLCLGSAAAFGQAAPGAGEILQTVPPATVRPDSGPSIDDRFSKPRAIADVEGMQLEIKGFRIVGLTVVPEAEMTQVLAPFIGPNKRFQDLLDAAAAVKRELAGRGYFLADAIVPEQKISNGIVELRVLEGRLGKVRLQVDPAGTGGSSRLRTLPQRPSRARRSTRSLLNSF